MKYEMISNLPINLQFVDQMHLQFRNITKKEAEKYFEWFLEQIPIRIKVLQEAVNSTPGYEDWKADYSPESLVTLGKWFKQVVTTRKRSEEEIEEIYKRSPEWFRTVKISENDLSPETYSLCFDVGMYLAKVFETNLKGLGWKLITAPKKSVDIHQPVLAGFGALQFNPVMMMSVQAFKVINGKYSDYSLKELYEIWAKYAKTE
ncbi:MAG: hypothetical protein K6U80_18270 [Firmicutes bacterium]|nr:hypothetical protein [Bacillota bacterium]